MSERDIVQELTQIAPAYQAAFRQALAQEMAPDLTDQQRLAFLRRRQEEMKQGAFIWPNGRQGMIALDDPAAVYEQALPQLAQSLRQERGWTAARRQMLLKAGGLFLVALLFLGLLLRGRHQRQAAAALPVPTAVTTAAAPGTVTPVPTLPLPPLTSVDEALQTIGGLGGALTIGRPSSLALSYQQSEETIALAIDPSRPTPKGELRYNPVTMASDNPVAVWVWGTVLNYAIGVPDSLVRSLQPGDRVTLSTDTGAALSFVVSDIWQGASYDVTAALSQNRVGMTLFSLPAPVAEAVGFAFAAYDLTAETAVTAEVYEPEDAVPIAGGGVQITAVGYSHTVVGHELQVDVKGKIENVVSPLMLSLSLGDQHTTAVPLDGRQWRAAFTLTDTPGAALFATFHAAAETAVVAVGAVPDLRQQLQPQIAAATLTEEGTAAVQIAVHNPGPGAVYIGPGYIQMLQGGDAYDLSEAAILVKSGETSLLPFLFLPLPVQLQIGLERWSIDHPIKEMK